MNRTNRFPINQVILEGPDLAGKTSFYNRIHKASGYKWNIQDRSALSMLVYAKLYNRDTFIEVERLNKELKDLNNRYVMLLPPWDEVARRFIERGDEIQNLSSLKKLYDLFTESSDELEKYPNVIVIRSIDTLSYVDQVIKDLVGSEMTTVKHLASYVNQFAAVTDDLEASHINMTFYDDGKFQFLNKAVLDYKPEKEYYASIMSKLFSKIADELTGKNKYNKEEGVNSRRFVYAEDSCISFAQFTVRNSILDCHFVLRSSNTKDTLNYDIQFLYYLCSKVYEMLELKDENCRIRINFNSAHIII
jgi:thymidylate kinase